MKNYKKIAAAISLIIASSNSFAQDSYQSRPDSHAPIGVMRDHIHKKGEYMLSYRYDLMNMENMRNGTENISSAAILDEYMMAPSKMRMEMHMVGAMYGVTDKFTVMAMTSYNTKKMKMLDMNNETSTQEVSDFGDLKLTAMYKIFDEGKNRAQFNLGFSIPSATIKKEKAGERLAYSMQSGSGSYEILPGISYSGFQENYSYGGQLNSTLRLNNNNSGYKLGDNYNINAWAARKLNESVSISSRLDYSVIQKIKGYDKTTYTMSNLMMSPSYDPQNSGRKELDFLVGANFIATKGSLKGHRLAIEGGLPVYQNISGNQMKNDYKLMFGWQKSF